MLPHSDYGGSGRSSRQRGSASAAAAAAAASIDPIGLVESATSDTLQGQPDWTLNMQIVDYLTAVPRDTPAILDILSKKLMSKKHSTGLLSAILLETLVKNVPHSHPYVGTRDFMEKVFVKSLPRSIRKPGERPSLNSLINEPSDIKSPLAIQRWETILRCIGQWAEAFNMESYPIFKEVHRMLERRGVRFPAVDKDESAPVFLAEKPKPQGQLASHPEASAPELEALSAPIDGASASAGAGSSSTSKDIKSALETVQIFKDMIQHAEPGYPLEQDELIQQLYASCRSSVGILSDRLTRAANSADTDERTMMKLISTHEAVQEVIKLYEDVVSGVRKSASNGGTAPSHRSHHQRGSLQESKEDDPFESSTIPDVLGRPIGDPFSAPVFPPSSSVGAPSTSSSSSAAVQKKTRRPSDLPVELTQFDMLGLSSSSPPVPAPAPAPAPVPVMDPFNSFPQPINPVLSVVASSPPASAGRGSFTSPGPKRTSVNGGATPSTPAAGLIAPPPSSTRHRKDSAAKRGSESGMTLGLQPSPKVTQQTPSHKTNDSLLDLDLLLSSNTVPPPDFSSASAAPASTSSTITPFNSFNPPQSSVNVFDSFASSNPVEINSTPVVSSNPFLAFDQAEQQQQQQQHRQEQQSQPIEDDPFAQIATRTPNPSTIPSASQNPFGL